uniref:Uncharacterized protein n=1 Tax=Arundo donax TaxID=35708 RepID=A0A0A9ALE5_ARUDO
MLELATEAGGTELSNSCKQENLSLLGGNLVK